MTVISPLASVTTWCTAAVFVIAVAVTGLPEKKDQVGFIPLAESPIKMIDETDAAGNTAVIKENLLSDRPNRRSLQKHFGPPFFMSAIHDGYMQEISRCGKIPNIDRIH